MKSTKNMPSPSKQDLDKTESKRFSVTFSGDAREQLDYLASNQGLTQVEVIRKAVATEAFLYEEIKQGGRVIIAAPDGNHREIVFR